MIRASIFPLTPMRLSKIDVRSFMLLMAFGVYVA